MSQICQSQSTGKILELLLQYRTKVFAEDAGLFQPSDAWKELISLNQEILSSFLSSNVLIAQLMLQDVVVVSKKTVSTTLSKRLLIPKLTTLSMDFLALATPNQMVQLRLTLTRQLKKIQLINLKLPLSLNQWLSLLMPQAILSCTTWKELSLMIRVVNLLIMPSSLLDTVLKTELSTTSSKTLGELTGEKRDTSESELLTELVSAVSNSSLLLLTQTEE
jgi:hypothetical protein